MKLPEFGLLSLLSALSLAGAGSFNSSPVQVSPTSDLYTRTEFEADVNGTYTTPFDQRQVAVDFVVTTPSGRTVVAPCYFESQASGVSVWKARYAARETGGHQAVFRLTEAGAVVATSEALSFSVQGNDKEGFFHMGSSWAFKLDNGKAFRGIGENVGWEGRSYENVNYTYDLFLPELATNGANFFRTWSCAWNLPLEFKKVTDTNRYAGTTEVYHPQGVKRIDELMTLCESLGMRVMFCMDQHGTILNNGQWALNNYNQINGGPCATPGDFFTNAEAKARYKNRLRFLVARWGGSTGIGAWEFFNEIDNAVYDGSLNHAAVTAWHGEMATYLKSIDPYEHPVTTSISWRDVTGLYDVPSIDFNQRHTYNNTTTIPDVIAQYLNANGKPFVDGEFAWDWDWNHVNTANGPSFDYDFKFGMWYGLFSPTPIVPMTWWWEFFHVRGMIPYMKGIRTINDRMLKAGSGSYQSLFTSAVGFHTLGVRCGDTLFVHAHNPGTSSYTSDIRITLPDTDGFVLETFDPETQVLTKVGPLTSSAKSLVAPSVTLKAKEQRVLIFTKNVKVTAAPQSQGAEVGTRTVLRVSASNGETFQWKKDGVTLAGATGSALILDPVAEADAGNYTCVVSGLSGDVESAPATVTVVSPGVLRLKNLSTRSNVGAGENRMIGGFVIRGTQPKTVLIRAAGPGLEGLGLTGVLSDPFMEVFQGSTLIDSNDDWDLSLKTVFTDAGAFAWSDGSADAALVKTLNPGPYTVQVSGKGGATGIAIFEVYDIDPESTSVLSNLSTRSRVGGGGDVQIAGFVLAGTAPKRVLVRAAGPALGAFGLKGVVSDPLLQLFSGASKFTENDSWDSGLAGEFAREGAFAWKAGSTDAAVEVALAPGAYTAQVAGQAGGGVAIVEVYECR